MKRLIKLLSLLCVMLALVFSACGGDPSPATGDEPGDQQGSGNGQEEGKEKEVVVAAVESSVQIKDEEVSSYDFTSLFTITVDGEKKDVLASYLDLSALSEAAGTYTVTCNYEGKNASVSVTVVATVYTLTLSVEEVTLKVSAVEGTDFLNYFTAQKDGVKDTITQDMVENTVRAEVGDYAVTVTYHGESKTLTVHVVSDHSVEVVLSYEHPEVPENALEDFDAASLFSLYIDGVAVEVTGEMLTVEGLDGASAGGTFTVELNYSANGITAAKSVTVSVTEARQIVITPKNIETYPNAEEIDLTTLFTIRQGDEEIPVTIDMIEGVIDYSKAGENNIVLTYGGVSATAVVTVRMGVIIDYAHSDAVQVKVGTDMETYPFADDFIVVINGARYLRIPDSCFDLSEVNFAEEGTYTATLTIRYGDQPSGNTFPPKFPEPQLVTKTITYVVVAAQYDLSVKEEFVKLPKGTTSYDPTSNLALTIDGYKQWFTTRRDYADGMTVYYEALTEIDFSSPEVQTVRLALYINGTGSEPVEVEYELQVETEIVIEAKDGIAFTGETLYTRDLFTVTENGEAVEDVQEYISGKVDTFKPGVYFVSINYKGLTAECKVVVYRRDFIGTYRTSLTTIPVEEEEEDDGEGGGWGDEYDTDWTSAPADVMPIAETAPTPLGGLTINADGSIRFNGISVDSITGVDENTMILHTGTNGTGRDYTLHYQDGIVVLEVENSIRLKFSDYARPLVYFHEDLWAMQEKLTVNDTSSYILQSHSAGHFSMDMTRLKSKTDGSELWFALYVKVLENLSSNTSYAVEWGEVTFEGDYSKEIGAENTIFFNGTAYHFAMKDATTGQTVAVNSQPYRNTTFTGSIDGKEATLVVNASNWYQLYVGTGLILQVLPNDLGNMKHGGERADGKVHLYKLNDETYGTYSYLFTLDTEAKTFVLEERDSVYGVYRRGNMLLFLDGYGTGNFYEDYSTTSFSSTEVTYTLKNGELHLGFETYDPKSVYGYEATFYVSRLLNVLTAKSSKNDIFSGEDFENTMISDGAIVKVNVTMCTARDQIIEGVSITTKDGELSKEEKNALINTNCVNFTQAGFYLFTVTVTVGGESVESSYAIQTFVSSYKGNSLVANYGQGVINGAGFGLRLDEYGRAYLSSGEVIYSGTFTIAQDNRSFIVKAYNENGGHVSAKGTVLAEGIIRVDCSGTLHYSDYFVIGSSSVAGTSGYVLRRFVSGSNTVYVACTSDKTVGEVVTVTAEGDIYTITQGDSVRRARIVWGSASSGITFLEG